MCKMNIPHYYCREACADEVSVILKAYFVAAKFLLTNELEMIVLVSLNATVVAEALRL